MPEQVAAAGPKRLTFYPFAYALYTEELIHYCWYCLAEGATKHCTGCGMALFCNKDCQSLGWKDHKAECQGFRTATTLPDIETRMLGRIVLRYKTIHSGKDVECPDFYKDRASERQILQIWAHTDKMRQDPHAMKKFDEVYENLTKFYDPKYLMSKETVFELHCRDYINRHAISDKSYMKEIGKGLYLDLCAYDHSCAPNTIYTCNGFVATLRALNSSVNLLDKKNTHYAYIDLLSSRQQRRKLLRDTWFFHCECARCSDNNDEMLTAMLCPNCPPDERKRLCMFGTHSYKDPVTQIITCPSCKEAVSQEAVCEAVGAMRFIDRIFEEQELEQMSEQTALSFLQDILYRFSAILPTVNVYFCRIIQAIIPRLPSDATKELLRMHELSEECVRFCFPANHPAIAFHLRNIGIFYNNLNKHDEAIKRLEEAEAILHHTLDADHMMSLDNRKLLVQVRLAALEAKEAAAAASEPFPAKSAGTLPKVETGKSEKEADMDEVHALLDSMSVAPTTTPSGEKLKTADLFQDGDDDMPTLLE